jgi:microcystin-dependent protein
MEGTIAEIRWWAANFAPRNWAYCNGQIIAIATNTALFSLLGTTYGGNGVQTFALPDFRGRAAVGTGTGPGLPSVQLGEQSGTESVTLIQSEMPAHSHPATTNATTETPTGNSAAGTFLASGTRAVTMTSIYQTGAADAPMGAGSIQVGPAGGNAPHSNIQPYLGMNHIICLYGIFPSRN